MTVEKRITDLQNKMWDMLKINYMQAELDSLIQEYKELRKKQNELLDIYF